MLNIGKKYILILCIKLVLVNGNQGGAVGLVMW